jgi:RHS repeat-associated protein
VDLTYIQQAGDTGTGDGGDQYTGLDRFGRVVDQRWIPTASPQSPTDRFQYTYDQDSNRLTRTNAVNNNFNEVYAYDNFNQLTNFSRGSHIQTWTTLDPLGNWGSNFSDVTSSVTSTQNRGNNTQNQITSLTGTGQFASWVAPSYDNNGNTVTDQFGRTLVYDAWNRLVQYKSGSTVLASSSYDTLGRRIQENVTLSRDLYYSSGWQVLEERSLGVTQFQYVWSPVYVDALVERDGGLVGRLYVQQDANWNLTGLVDTLGAVRERYAYDPYGKATILDPTWVTRASSLFGWIYLHQGGRLDGTTGLYNFRMRDYSPTLGRWMQEDPIRYGAGDANLYGYLLDRPTGAIDPNGLQMSLQGAVQSSTLMEILYETGVAIRPVATAVGVGGTIGTTGAVIVNGTRPRPLPQPIPNPRPAQPPISPAPAVPYPMHIIYVLPFLPSTPSPSIDAISAVGGAIIVSAVAPAHSIDIQPGKGHQRGEPLTEQEAIDQVRNGGDVIANCKDMARKIAEQAGDGPPIWNPPHNRPGEPPQRPHYHPTQGGERLPGAGHVLY